jgi:uncharacterized membrane protein/Spy/CpxP family protein refolding chaperone
MLGIEIIPNWHPLLVHFTIALLTTATILYLLAIILPKKICKLQELLLPAARINLWLGALISLVTVAAGIHAFMTVAHDNISHPVMLFHRNLALLTVTAFIILAIFSFVRYSQDSAAQPKFIFVVLLMLATGSLMYAGYKGSELVYKHGLGVERLPKHSPSIANQYRDIKAHSMQKIAAYINGKGMGLAKAAELNHYPGSKHVLELSSQLNLSQAQITKTKNLYQNMHKQAVYIGQLIVEKEKILDALFSTQQINEENLRQVITEIHTYQGDLRFIHLKSHIQQKNILSKEQAKLYDAIRSDSKDKTINNNKHKHHNHAH